VLTGCLCAPVASFRQLHSDEKVIFAAYQMPHPLVNELKVKARFV
jgi:DNA-directed RNA polymerase subunit L